MEGTIPGGTFGHLVEHDPVHQHRFGIEMQAMNVYASADEHLCVTLEIVALDGVTNPLPFRLTLNVYGDGVLESFAWEEFKAGGIPGAHSMQLRAPYGWLRTPDSVQLRVSPTGGRTVEDITHRIERLELLEERLGVRLEGLFAEVGRQSDGELRVVVRGELHGEAAPTIEDDLMIACVVQDPDGRVIETRNEYIRADKFFGLHAFELSSYVSPGLVVGRVRLYPAPW